MTEPIVTASHLTKIYQRKQQQIMALVDVSLNVLPGEFVAIVGRSGSGKSTLLSLLGGLDQPDRGEVQIEGIVVNQLTPKEAAVFRRKSVGFLFQLIHLLPTLTALENIELPFAFEDEPSDDYRERALALLKAVHLDAAANSLPDQLSGGERQRIGVARALVNNPKLILADEPTGNLDHETGGGIIKLLKQQTREHDMAVVMVTHDRSIAQQADRIVQMHDGKVEN